jgi:hypothetical protein
VDDSFLSNIINSALSEGEAIVNTLSDPSDVIVTLLNKGFVRCEPVTFGSDVKAEFDTTKFSPNLYLAQET